MLKAFFSISDYGLISLDTGVIILGGNCDGSFDATSMVVKYDLEYDLDYEDGPR